MPKRTLSEIKYVVNDWLLDELGVSADALTERIDATSSFAAVSEVVSAIIREQTEKDRVFARKLALYWSSVSN